MRDLLRLRPTPHLHMVRVDGCLQGACLNPGPRFALCPWQRLREPVAAADATLAEPLAAGSGGHVHGPALPHPARATPARESGPALCPCPVPGVTNSTSSDRQPRAGGWAFLGPLQWDPWRTGRGGLGCSLHRPLSDHDKPSPSGCVPTSGAPRLGEQKRWGASQGWGNPSHFPTGRGGGWSWGVGGWGGHFRQRKQVNEDPELGPRGVSDGLGTDEACGLWGR